MSPLFPLSMFLAATVFFICCLFMGSEPLLVVVAFVVMNISLAIFMCLPDYQEEGAKKSKELMKRQAEKLRGRQAEKREELDDEGAKEQKAAGK